MRPVDIMHHQPAGFPGRFNRQVAHADQALRQALIDAQSWTLASWMVRVEVESMPVS